MIHAHIASPALPVVAPTQGRFDPYALIHKALRKAQCDMLVRLGQADFKNPATTSLLTDLRQLLTFGSQHIAHEEVFVHPVLKARAPGATDALDAQHGSHRAAFETLEDLIAQLAVAPADEKAAFGRRLYLTYSAFVAHDLEHMLEEETVGNAQLWALFSDDELHQIERAIVASLTPEKAMLSMKLMIPAINRDERAILLGGMKAHAPKPAFDAVMEVIARNVLSREDFADLEQRLGLVEA